jgi:hypothetical protein
VGSASPGGRAGLLALGAVLVDLVGLTVLHQAELGAWLITLAVTLPCTAVGVLLAARRPANPSCRYPATGGPRPNGASS